MPSDSVAAESAGPRYREWLLGPLSFLALLVVVRFATELAGLPSAGTRVLSSSGAVFLVAIYLGAVAPLRGVRRSWQLLVPGVVLTVWVAAWVILATLISGALRLERSHFAQQEDFGNWPHLGRHVWEHVVDIIPTALVVLVLMAAVYLLWRWPMTVAPGAMLGGLVIVRFWAEAINMSPTTATAWSSTVGALLCGFYLGGVGPRLGISTFKQLLLPSLVIGWVWRFWNFLAAVMAAAAPYYKTHFFDPSSGQVAFRLLKMFAGGFVVEGFFAGLLVWGVAAWTLYAIYPSQET